VLRHQKASLLNLTEVTIMSLAEGIREVIADVGVQTTDINTAAVTAAKLGNSAVTPAKIHLDVGRWAKGSFDSSGVTWAGTAAFTVLQGYIRVTAAAAGLITMGTTADADAVFACTSTVATTYGSNAGAVALNAAVNVVTAQNTGMPDISAGGSLIISAGASVAGNYFFLYIAT
jgi:hypothetical protein